MPEVRPSPKPLVHFALIQIPVVFVGLGGLWAVLAGWTSPWVGGSVLLAAVLASMVLTNTMMRRVPCPECRRRLDPPRGWSFRFPGKPILMRCANCDVDWDVGLRGQED